MIEVIRQKSFETRKRLPGGFKNILKVSSVIPSLISMGSIYSFSAQTGEESAGLSYMASYGIVSFINKIFTLGMNDPHLAILAGSCEFFIRKAAHFSEYFILALCVLLPLYVYKVDAGKRGYITILICSLYACLDEFHQSFSAGRSPQLRDVIIDSIGAACAIAICYLIRTIRNKKAADNIRDDIKIKDAA